MEPARSLQQRKADTLAKLQNDADLWLSTAARNGTPYLIPLSLAWDGTNIIVAIPWRSRTAQNLSRRKTVRIAIGPTRDVVMIDAIARRIVSVPDAPDIGELYARRADWDPRNEGTEHVFAIFEPRRVQAWREVNELPSRTIMKDGKWLE